MIPTLIVNGRTVVHRQSDGQAVSGPPDVCLTPGPSGPTPIAYVNTAFSRDLIKAASTVTADGCPIAISTSEFATSTGDEPGTAGGGVASHVIKGKAKFINYSMDVFAEGKNVCRLADPMSMNGNAPNTTNPAEAQGNLSPLGDMQDILCRAFCWCDSGKSGKDFVKPVSGMLA